MLFQRLIPSLLLKSGRLVKGVRYQGFRDAGNPRTTARAHNHQGADELIVVDIDASKNNCGPDVKTISTIAEECFMPLCVGGGIRDMVSAHACMEAGADKLCLTTSAMDSPKLIAELAHRFGSQAIVVGIDVAYDETGTARLFDHRSGRIITNLDLWKYVEHVVKLGAGEIRLMAVDREGTLLGYDMSLFARIKELVDIPIILEGGAGSLHHLQEAFEAGVDGIASGAMLVFSDAKLVKIKKHMITNRCNIRD